MKQRVPLLTAAIGMGPLQCTGTAEATQARQRLGAAGVSVDTLGAVSFTSAAAAEYEGGPWLKDTPATQLGSLALQQQTPPSQEDALPGGLLSRLPKRFASRIFRHLEALTATRVWRAHPQHRRESMLSSRGPGAGVILARHAQDSRALLPQRTFPRRFAQAPWSNQRPAKRDLRHPDKKLAQDNSRSCAAIPSMPRSSTA